MVSKRELKPDLPSNCLQIFSELVEQCCNFEANQRPTFQQICDQLKKDFDEKFGKSNLTISKNEQKDNKEYNHMLSQTTDSSNHQ